MVSCPTSPWVRRAAKRLTLGRRSQGRAAHARERHLSSAWRCILPPRVRPTAYNVIRKAALRMALVRALVKAADIVKRSRARKQQTGTIIQIFDRAMLELRDRCEALGPLLERFLTGA